MGRLLIFTAGTSLFENLKDPQKLNCPELVKLFRYDGPNAYRTVLRRPHKLASELRAHAEVISSIDLSDPAKRNHTTAEMASLYLLHKDNPEGDDRLVLLCSDTGQGAFCALVNGMLLGHEVRFDHPRHGFTIDGFSDQDVEFHKTLKDIRLPEVELRVVNKLNPERPEKFESIAIPELVKTIADLHYNRPPDTQTILNYTGGFKAAIPTLTQAVAVAGDIDLVCLYEDATEVVRQPVVPIDLSPETREQLTWAGRDAPGHPDVLHPDPERDGGYETIQQLKADRKFERGWVFYEAAPQGGVRLNGLGLAMQELLSAQTHQQRQEEDAPR